jgi:hypothetical protein
MKVFTYANKQHAGLDLLLTSANLHGIQIEVLGSKNDVSVGHESGVFGNKLLHMKRALESIVKTTPEELVMFVDAFDVVFYENEDMIVRCISVLLTAAGPSCKAIFASERHESPIENLPWETDRVMKFLNSGCYVGRAEKLLTLFSPLEKYSEPAVLHFDDQLYFYARKFEDPSSIYIDHGCLLFGCMNKANAIALPGGGALMLHSNVKPCILHFQGFEKNILPFVPADLRPLALKIHNIKQPHSLRDALEKFGSFFPPIRKHSLLRYALWRAIFVLLLLLLLVLS